MVLGVSLVYVFPHAAILQIILLFSMIWYDRIQSSAVSKQRDVRWCGFRWSIPLSIDNVWYTSIDRAISTPSCSYCIWNRYCKNHRSNFSNFLLFTRFETVEFNRLPCPNNKLYDDSVFADRFRYEWTMFWIPVLICLSRLLHAHIAYEIDTAEFPIVCMIWYDWIQSSAMFKHQDVLWCGWRWSILIWIDYVWSVFIDMAISTPWYSYCTWNSYIKNHYWWLSWCGKRSFMLDCCKTLI